MWAHNLGTIEIAFMLLAEMSNGYGLYGEGRKFASVCQNYKYAYALTQQFPLQKLYPVFFQNAYE